MCTVHVCDIALCMQCVCLPFTRPVQVCVHVLVQVCVHRVCHCVCAGVRVCVCVCAGVVCVSGMHNIVCVFCAVSLCGVWCLRGVLCVVSGEWCVVCGAWFAVCVVRCAL